MALQDAGRKPCPSQDEWTAFQERLESMLESHFRQQERHIQRCFERLAPGLAGPAADAAAAAPAARAGRGTWDPSGERGGGALVALAGAGSPSPGGSEGAAIQRSSQIQRVPSSTTPQWASGGSAVSSAGGVSSPRGEHRRPSVVSGGSAVSSAGDVSSPRGPEHRRPSVVKQSRLTWEISMQDRARAKELRSQKSHLSMKEMWNMHLYQWLDWYMSLEEPPRSGCLARFVLSKKFEAICAIVIVANAAFAAYTTNYEIEHLQEKPTFVANTVEWGFLGFYSVELALKLSVHRLFFFCNDDMRFNLFDLFLVVTSLYYQVSISLMAAGGFDLTYMRTLRILKLARILRVIRVAKFFTELRLMLNSVLGSFISLFWAFVMLVLVFYIFGLVFVQGTTTYLIQHGEQLDDASRDRIDRAFGSVERAMLSLYKATTGGSDWENLFDSPIIERMGWLNIAFFIFLIAFIQVALMNILTGLFVENALKLAQPDRDLQALEHRKKELLEAQELRQMCEVVDKNQSGTIDPQEFMENFQVGSLRAHLEVLGLHIRDADLFFEMLTAESGISRPTIDIDDFVAGCMRLRGTATSLDLQTVLHCIKIQNSSLRQFYQACEFRFNELADRLPEVALTPGHVTI